MANYAKQDARRLEIIEWVREWKADQAATAKQPPQDKGVLCSACRDPLKPRNRAVVMVTFRRHPPQGYCEDHLEWGEAAFAWGSP